MSLIESPAFSTGLWGRFFQMAIRAGKMGLGNDDSMLGPGVTCITSAEFGNLHGTLGAIRPDRNGTFGAI